MKPHPRIRKTVKWGAAVVVALLLVVWIGSGEWSVCYVGTGWEIGLSRGEIAIFLYSDPTPLGRHGWSSGAGIGRIYWCWSFVYIVASRFWEICIPLWVLGMPSLVATAVAWRLDTLARCRARLNLCPKCNYDRTGLAPGVACPECGGKQAPQLSK